MRLLLRDHAEPHSLVLMESLRSQCIDGTGPQTARTWLTQLYATQAKVLALQGHVLDLQRQLEKMELERTHDRFALPTTYSVCPASAMCAHEPVQRAAQVCQACTLLTCALYGLAAINPTLLPPGWSYRRRTGKRHLLGRAQLETLRKFVHDPEPAAPSSSPESSYTGVALDAPDERLQGWRPSVPMTTVRALALTAGHQQGCRSTVFGVNMSQVLSWAQHRGPCLAEVRNQVQWLRFRV